MGLRRTTSLGQPIDDHEDGSYAFVGDHNATNSVSTPDCNEGLQHWGASPSASTDETPGLTSSVAAELESEPDRLFQSEKLISDPAQINGATCHPESPAHSNGDDGARASVLASEANDADPVTTAWADNCADLQDNQNILAFGGVDDGMGPGLLTNVEDPGGPRLGGEPQPQGGSTPSDPRCGPTQTEAVTSAYAIVDRLLQLLSSNGSPDDLGRLILFIAEGSPVPERDSSGNDNPGHADCPLLDWREALDQICSVAREIPFSLLESGFVDAARGDETGSHVFPHELLP
jgi:hypothetical protein